MRNTLPAAAPLVQDCRVLKKSFLLPGLLLFCAVLHAEPVQIEFFYAPGCAECARLEATLFPEIERRFGNACAIKPYDIGIESNFLYLLRLEYKTGYTGEERAYLLLNQKYAFGATPDRDVVCARISDLLRRSPAMNGPAPEQADDDSALITKRYGGFALPAVVLAGVLDGINPCAISTLVFFMSLLAVSKIRNRQLLLLGGSFCLASFLAYLALGFGLLRSLYLFSGFTALRNIAEWIMSAALLVLAVLSFRDAIRFRKTGRAADVTLQLSSGMKKRIHEIMHRGIGSGHLVLGGLCTGAAVTALESVCTGQVYVPTLALILKSSAYSAPRAWLLLLLYNGMFILPLVLVFIAVYFGLRTETLLIWSRKNAVLSKFLLGLFFTIASILILVI
jgi:cytochrome c biogenesis protein CcdA